MDNFTKVGACLSSHISNDLHDPILLTCIIVPESQYLPPPVPLIPFESNLLLTERLLTLYSVVHVT